MVCPKQSVIANVSNVWEKKEGYLYLVVHVMVLRGSLLSNDIPNNFAAASFASQKQGANLCSSQCKYSCISWSLLPPSELDQHLTREPLAVTWFPEPVMAVQCWVDKLGCKATRARSITGFELAFEVGKEEQLEWIEESMRNGKD